MLFGFVGAAVAGFLLTAIPNWTGRLPIAGKPLLSLFGLWRRRGRGAVLRADRPLACRDLDVGLFLVSGRLAAREVAASNKRNVPMVGLVFLFGLADAADYAGAAAPYSGGPRLARAIALVVIMISLIGGRIIPSFTRTGW